jgi:predicted polyphosphate/ATP-dependent NAD kinase
MHKPSAVGILANPAAGRDIRRLVAQASVFPLAEKCNMISRLLAALAAGGVERVYMMPDAGGISRRLRRMLKTPSPQPSPPVTFFDMPVEDSAADTLLAVERMVAVGVDAIVVLGGDGTPRLVARVCGDTPLTALSTGTNNVFPALREATIAGLATALVATGQVDADEATCANKALRVSVNGTRDLALVDICVSTDLWTGSKALWGADGLSQLFVAFAEADAVGLSSVAGLMRPVSRRDRAGVRLELAPPDEAAVTVTAPIAPGLIVPVGVAAVYDMLPGERQTVGLPRGVIALDGEREIEFTDGDRVAVWIDADGPRTIDIDRVMACAAQRGLLTVTHNPDSSTGTFDLGLRPGERRLDPCS